LSYTLGWLVLITAGKGFSYNGGTLVKSILSLSLMDLGSLNGAVFLGLLSLSEKLNSCSGVFSNPKYLLSFKVKSILLLSFFLVEFDEAPLIY
jgi:hypothetical protein